MGNGKRQEQQIKVHGYLLSGLGLKAVSFVREQLPFAGFVLVPKCQTPSQGTKQTSEAGELQPPLGEKSKTDACLLPSDATLLDDLWKQIPLFLPLKHF